MSLADRLIDEWRLCLRYTWSVRLTALGLLWEAVRMVNETGLLPVWNLMPWSVRKMLPPWLEAAVSVVLFGAALIARVWKQPKLDAKRRDKALVRMQT